MVTCLQLPANWTAAEIWAWTRIAAGEVADFNSRDREGTPDFRDLDPADDPHWTDSRRLSAKFLQTILTQKAFIDATPFCGVRILGALVDDAPIMLNHARLESVFWLEKSRILVPIKAVDLSVDGHFSLEASFVAEEVELSASEFRKSISLAKGLYKLAVNLNSAKVQGAALCEGATFKGVLDLRYASIGSALVMSGSTFEGAVSLNSAKVQGAALCEGATFKGVLDLGSATIGSRLVMSGSTFEGAVSLNGATVKNAAFLERATFKAKVDLGGASIGSALDMSGSTFEGAVSLNGATVKNAAFLERATFKAELNLVGASISPQLGMSGSTFEGAVSLTDAKVQGAALCEGATFKAELNLRYASIGPALDISAAQFSQRADLTGARIEGELRLVSLRPPASWDKGATLVLRNAHCDALQDWWRSDDSNSWPERLELKGFTYNRLGTLHSADRETDMLSRPASSYAAWLRRDTTFSSQPYEYLAHVFQEAGEPEKANDILYAARERRRKRLLARIDSKDQARAGQWLSRVENGLKWLGMSLLKWTIGYGLGGRTFRVLGWIGGLAVLGMLLLKFFGTQPERNWVPLLFASLDRLLPGITLNEAHKALFGDTSTKLPSPLQPYCQPYWLVVYFYAHKISGWVLGSFLVAALAGLTQKN